MKTAHIQSRCECQAKLSAVVEEDGTVILGSATSGKNATVQAPSTAIGAGAEQFQVGWQCPICGRNTVRSFYRGALVFSDSTSV